MGGENHRSEGHYHQTAKRQEMPFSPGWVLVHYRDGGRKNDDKSLYF